MSSDDESVSEMSEEKQIFSIFNEIQTGSNSKENLKNLVSLYESVPISEFNQVLEDILLIIFYNFDKNTCPLRNIRDFLKSFIELIIKNQKLKKQNKEFINYFCSLLTLNAKKVKYKQLALYFLNVFLGPYSSGYALLYEANTLKNIRAHVLDSLNKKQTVILQNALQLLEKHPTLQKDEDIWERLELLLNGDNKIIKREIIKLFENSNENITKYLLDMFDDQSIEIRQFAFEKLCKIKDFHGIDPKIKVKIFFTGLSDTSQKVQQLGKRLLRNYLSYLGIIKGILDKTDNNKEIDNDKMDIDDENLNVTQEQREDDLNISNDDLINETAKDKILKSTSPMKPLAKKLKSSPSRIFDELDVISFYSHPKYSNVFTLITEAMMEIIDKDDIILFCKEIVSNLESIVNKIGEIKKFSSSDKKRQSSFSSNGKERVDKYALFNDIYFIQNCLCILSHDKQSESFRSDIIDLLPDGSTFAKILVHFYINQTNIFIMHQLLLIAQYMPFQDEIGNREIMAFVKQYVTDISLYNKKISDFSFKKISLNNLDEIQDSQNNSMDEENKFQTLNEMNEDMDNEVQLINTLLPSNRRIIMSMDDLVPLCLRMVKTIYSGKDNLLFNDLLELVSDLNEKVDVEGDDNTLKKKQNSLMNEMKQKIVLVEQMKASLDNEEGNKRIEAQKKINEENRAIDTMDNELVSLFDAEEKILLRITTICRFAVGNCHLPQSNYDTMLREFLIPNLRRNNFPDLVHSCLEVTGLLSINYFNGNYKNFMKLFFDNIQRSSDYFKVSTRISLEIIFDSMLQNNLLLLSSEVINNSTIDEQLQLIVNKYLYHENYISRIIVFIGLCKLLIADRMTKHEFFLSRLLVNLNKSYKMLDRESEEYCLVIYEILNNFAFFYSIKGKKYVKNVVKAVSLILCIQMFSMTDATFDKSVHTDYLETKYEFLNTFLWIVHENSMNKTQYKFEDLLFKVFKFLCYIIFYVHELENNIKKERPKLIEKTPNLYKNVKTKIKNFLSKYSYDSTLLDYFKESDDYQKFFAFLMKLKSIDALDSLSLLFKEEYSQMEAKEFKVEIKGTLYDLGTEEKKKELTEYVDRKEEKYYVSVEEYFNFSLQLMENKFKTIIDDTSKIIELDEENENEINNEKEKQDETDKSIIKTRVKKNDKKTKSTNAKVKTSVNKEYKHKEEPNEFPKKKTTTKRKKK